MKCPNCNGEQLRFDTVKVETEKRRLIPLAIIIIIIAFLLLLITVFLIARLDTFFEQKLLPVPDNVIEALNTIIHNNRIQNIYFSEVDFLSDFSKMCSLMLGFLVSGIVLMFIGVIILTCAPKKTIPKTQMTCMICGKSYYVDK